MIVRPPLPSPAVPGPAPAPTPTPQSRAGVSFADCLSVAATAVGCSPAPNVAGDTDIGASQPFEVAQEPGDPIPGNRLAAAPNASAPDPGGVVPTGNAEVAEGMPPSPIEPVTGMPVQIEWHVRDARGRTEIVSLPWRLAAAGHLAQEVVSAIGIHGATQRHGVAAVAAAPDFTVVHVTRPASIAAAVADDSRPAAAAPAIVPERTSSPASSEPDAPIPSSDSSPAAAPLAAQLLRWIERQGHKPSLWIRDYRLDEADAQAIARGMRQLAREQGLQLERIVVNARELWRAPNSSHAREERICP